MLQALDLARRIEAGELSPADVVDLCAKAIDAREKEGCAFAALDVARAREKARGTGLASRPLRGLPVGVKDIFDTVDFPTELGTPIYKGNQPRADAALVALIRRAGGIVLGKMVTTELAFLNPSRTHNPHDVAR
jgi:Asp-tRNA(Asn)/Glu-tRNA(Gln) amidotransferase A subunit family amidase